MSESRSNETRVLDMGAVEALVEAERSGLPFLHWRTEAGTQDILRLDQDRWRVTVGRKSECDIALTWDPEVSRTHALIERVGGHWMVVDDGLSTNGSFVNESPVAVRQRLHDHDRLRFGNTVLM